MTATIAVPRRLLRALRRAAGGPPDYIADAHTKQRAFVLDRRSRIAMLGGRRGGKTDGIGRRFINAAQRWPGALSVYVTLTRGRAKAILWDQCLRPMSERYGLGLRKVHDEGLLYIVFPNGHRIWLVGVDNQSEVDKLRGNKFAEAVIDEAMAMPGYLRELVEDSIEPSLMELQGSLVIAGSPSAVMAGYFFEATTGASPDVQQWPLHHFTVLDNVFIPHARGFLVEKVKTSYGGDESHPTYRREWLGEWVEDLGALVYPFTYEKNSWQPVGSDFFGLPPGEYSFGLGVDVGFSERSTAFTLAALRKGTGQIYLLRSWTRSRLIPTALAAACQAIRDEVARATKTLENPKGLSLQIVVDEGALGKGFAEQMRDMGVGCEAAEKSEKRAYQEYVGGLIRSSAPPYQKRGQCRRCNARPDAALGWIGDPSCPACGGEGEVSAGTWEGGFGVLVNFGACAELIDEARKLQFDDETGKESELYRKHCVDSALYIIRKMMPRYEPKENGPEPGSPEAIRAEMKRVKEAEIKKRQKGRTYKYG